MNIASLDLKAENIDILKIYDTIKSSGTGYPNKKSSAAKSLFYRTAFLFTNISSIHRL